MRLLLIQVRDHDDPMIGHEIECVHRRLDGNVFHIEPRNALAESPDPRWLDGYDGFLIGGSGDYSVHHPDSDQVVTQMRHVLERALELHLPGFLICFGHQLLGHHFGSEVITCSDRTEVGTHRFEVTDDGRDDPVFGHLPDEFVAQTGHSDHVTAVPDELALMVRNKLVETQGFKVRDAPIWSTQFHPDLTGPEARQRYLGYKRALAEFVDPERVKRAERFQYDPCDGSVLLSRWFDVAF